MTYVTAEILGPKEVFGFVGIISTLPPLFSVAWSSHSIFIFRASGKPFYAVNRYEILCFSNLLCVVLLWKFDHSIPRDALRRWRARKADLHAFRRNSGSRLALWVSGRRVWRALRCPRAVEHPLGIHRAVARGTLFRLSFQG